MAPETSARANPHVHDAFLTLATDVVERLAASGVEATSTLPVTVLGGGRGGGDAGDGDGKKRGCC